MSIVALKRKSQRFQNPISAHGFSLNGGLRNFRAIGDTNLAQLKSSMAVGCCFNDPTIIKRSTQTTRGHLFQTVKYPMCQPCPNTGWVKDFSPENHSQSLFVRLLAAQLAGRAAVPGTNGEGEGECAPLVKATSLCVCAGAKSTRIGGRIIRQNNYTKNVNQGAVTAGEYLLTGVMQQHCLPTPANRQAWPPSILHNGCDVNAQTPAEAIALGLLPADWRA